MKGSDSIGNQAQSATEDFKNIENIEEFKKVEIAPLEKFSDGKKIFVREEVSNNKVLYKFLVKREDGSLESIVTPADENKIHYLESGDENPYVEERVLKVDTIFFDGEAHHYKIYIHKDSLVR